MAAWRLSALAAGPVVAAILAVAAGPGCERAASGGDSMQGRASAMTSGRGAEAAQRDEGGGRADAARDVRPREPVTIPNDSGPVQAPAYNASEETRLAVGEHAPAAVPADAVDDGAALLVESMREAIGLDSAQAAASHGVEIAIRSLRNQSRGTAEELRVLRSRLLAVLGAAAEGRFLRFVDEPTAQTEYTLSGSVYLIERGGDDFWELYLALRPSGANWRIWKNADPIRLEREKQMAGDDLIEYPGGG